MLDKALLFQRKCVNALSHIDECIKENKPIATFGLPEDWTPHDLSTYYIEQYYVLEETKRLKISDLQDWLKVATSRADNSVVTAAEISALSRMLK
jgi:hypothetical protein